MPECFDGFRSFPPRPVVECTEQGARQSEAAACDINTIVAQYDRTGLLPQTGLEALYTDVSGMGDYRSAVEQVRVADRMFMALPAKVRARFNNDAAYFLDFCSDERNRPELMDLGLVEKVVEELKRPPVAPVAPSSS